MTEHNALQGDPVPDPQADVVLSWERDFVESRIPARIMGREQCSEMIEQAARFLGLPTPRIEYGPVEGGICLAVPAEHALRVQSWGRAQSRILHEVAHLATWRGVCQGEAPHGPAFVGVAIQLYERFLGLSGAELEDSASRMGIDLIPALKPSLAYHGPGRGAL